MTITVKFKTQKNRWNPKLVYLKDLDDVGDIIFDYSGVLGGDTVSTATATTDDITAGTPSISSNVVTTQISGGVSGSTGKMEMRITTTNGSTLSNLVRFKVTDYYQDA